MTQEFKDASSCWKAILSDVSGNRGLLSVIEKFAREQYFMKKKDEDIFIIVED